MGRYEIGEEIGRGAMGVVYRGTDRELGLTVALKRLPDELIEDPATVALFLSEARAAAALNHPNIVRVLDADRAGNAYYIVMEYLDGLPLDRILVQRGRLAGRDVVRLALQIAAGLEYAHDERIVHRDIKPSNLFYTRARQVKIMDFGLARMMEEVRRQSPVIAGTPYYMAPEQSLGEAVDHRADLYALGVTMFELATGSVPFDTGEVAYHHRHTAPPDPRELAHDLPDAFCELVLRLMAKTPEDRFDTTGELVATLHGIARELAPRAPTPRGA